MRYVEHLLARYGFYDATSVTVPADPHSSSDYQSSESDDLTDFPYSSCVGSLQFASQGTRLDITYATSHAGKFSSHPKVSHVGALRRILKYLRGSSGYVLVLNGGPIAWGSRKQTCTATSTTEAEYVAAHLCSQEVIWMCRLLADLCCPQAHPTVLYSDNQAAIRLVRNPEFHRRTKHIDVKFHKLREAEANGELQITYINTADQIADVLTKALPRDKFQRMKGLLGLTDTAIDSPSSSRVGVL